MREGILIELRASTRIMQPLIYQRVAERIAGEGTGTEAMRSMRGGNAP